MSSIIRLATYLADRNDKADEDIAVFLARIADLAERISEKWEVNLRNIYDLKYRANKFREDRVNVDFLSICLRIGATSISNIALAHRSNSAESFELDPVYKVPRDEMWERRERRRKKDYPHHFPSEVKQLKVQSRRPKAILSKEQSAASEVLKVRSDLKADFDEVFKALDEVSGDDLRVRLDLVDVDSVRERVDLLHQQAATLRQISSNFRAQIR
ncbi:MAG: hypothetical protein U5N55_04020 [Cypionkella sp.]|nr:hypothetical protein [Cypionkella sp.]